MKTIRRRRHENKTDYKARFGLLKSGKERLIFRKTNRYIIGQIVKTEIAQDKVITGVNSKDLLEKGWPKNKQGSLKNITASYLTGFLIGKKAKEKDIKTVIFDIGMYRNVHKSRIFAFLKGSLDAGIEINHDPKTLPEDKDFERNVDYKTLIKIKEKI